MKLRILAILLLVAAAGCQSKQEKLKGVWRLQNISGGEENTGSQDLNAMMNAMVEMNLRFTYDGSNTATIIGGDTMKTMPYEVRNDSLIVHAEGMDMIYSYEIDKDTLSLKDPQGYIMKMSRVKE